MEWVHCLFLFPLVLGKMYIVVACKIGFFCGSLDNLLQKNVIVFFFENQISKWRSFEKKGLFLTYFSHFLVTRGKLQKFLQHISHSHTYMFFLTLLTFCLTNFENNTNLSGMVSHGMIPGVDSYSRHFGTINK